MKILCSNCEKELPMLSSVLHGKCSCGGDKYIELPITDGWNGLDPKLVAPPPPKRDPEPELRVDEMTLSECISELRDCDEYVNDIANRIERLTRPDELSIIELLDGMCIESCPPDAHDAWELVRETLIKNRGLK